MKRFWKDVAVDTDGVVRLDDRPVRTPGRVPLSLPTPALAEAVAEEWRSVGETLDLRAMPLTGLANATIDRVAPDKARFAAELARYGESDLLCYRADGPEPLVERQAAGWNPVLAWALARYDVHLECATGIIHRTQPEPTIQRLRDVTAALDPFRLAALSPIVTITGSLLLGLALVEGEMTPDGAWHAAHIDEDWQIELWGEDALATQARQTRRREFDAATRFAGLLA